MNLKKFYLTNTERVRILFSLLVNTLSKYRTFNILNRKLKTCLVNGKQNPITNKPLANKDEYLLLWNDEILLSYSEVDYYLNQLNANVPKEWIDSLALPTQVSIKESKINYQHGFILYKALTNYIVNTKVESINIVEIGTAKGFSALCMAKVLDDMGINGIINSIYILPHKKSIYWNSIKDHEGKHTRRELLNTYSPLIIKYIQFIQGKSDIELPKLNISRIHFAFIDGEHFYENVFFDGEFIAKRQHSGDMIVFDDYTKKIFPGVVQAANEICENYKYKTTVIVSSKQRSYLVAEKR